jgi:hypothetical protein
VTDRDDPFERLRAADPARRAVPMPALDRERIFRQVVTSGRPDPLRVSQRRRMLALVGAVFLMAAAYVVFRPVTEPLTVACYGAADLDADIVVVEARTVDDLVESCRPLWRADGEFGAQLDGGPPPDLQACVLDTGAVGVFPTAAGSQVCDDLGLALPASDSPEQNQAVIELRDELVDAFLAECLGVEEARVRVEEALVRRGLDDWQVIVTQAFTEERPCPSLAFDVPAQTVELVPVSR